VAPPKKQPQAFGPSADVWLRGGAVFCLAVVLGLTLAVYVFGNRDGYDEFGVNQEQPVIFSHRHHSGELGIDCRFCHTTVEKSSFAGMPSTETCLTCHSQLFRESPLLQPVWDSLRHQQPVPWNRVHDLGDFVYFDHSVHVNNGVSCRSCHGDVEDMVTVSKTKDITMLWCIECHRNPEPRLVPEGDVVNVRRQADPLANAEHVEILKSSPFDAEKWKRAHTEAMSEQMGREVNNYNLTDCTTCHR